MANAIENARMFKRNDEGREKEELEEVERMKRKFEKEIAMELVYSLSENLVIMSTSMVASMILMKRQGGLKEEDLLEKVVWLYSEILARKGATSINITPSQATIRNALKYLASFIDTKKDVVFSSYIKANMDYKNILMLSYYRNNLIHLFLNESYIATSLNAFGDQTSLREGISFTRLWDQTDFLTNILWKEFMVRDQIRDQEQLKLTIQFMEKRNFITVEKQNIIKITNDGKFPIQFLSSLLLPFVESYWVTLAFIK